MSHQSVRCVGLVDRVIAGCCQLVAVGHENLAAGRHFWRPVALAIVAETLEELASLKVQVRLRDVADF